MNAKIIKKYKTLNKQNSLFELFSLAIQTILTYIYLLLIYLLSLYKFKKMIICN